MRGDADYYTQLPIFEGFANIVDPTIYRPLPDGWFVGLTDVVNSTQAIEAGRYKAVNTAGASVIAAVTNALRGRKFPYVFGGDGASFVVPGGDEALAREALAATVAWAHDDLDLDLRAALVPVSEIRNESLNVSVARFAPSKNVSYAMFSGGGLAWAERAMKAGRFAVAPAAPGTRPDLSGMSCRWNDIRATNGIILSVLITPIRHGDPAFRRLVEQLVAELESSAEVARPVPVGAPPIGWPSPGAELEARASRKPGESLALRRLRVMFDTLVAFVVLRLNLRVGAFDPMIYRQQVVENSDFRKYDDNLRMTLDCTPAIADRLEETLLKAEADNIARFGLHRQPTAIMTCIVPSISDGDHVHFIDGASGGYALAARRLRAVPGNSRQASSPEISSRH
jgi:Protein of unknown function (DUF3095)